MMPQLRRASLSVFIRVIRGLQLFNGVKTNAIGRFRGPGFFHTCTKQIDS